MALSPLRPEDPEQVGGFRLSARLGAGGMGVVYLGADRAGRPAAIKVIRDDFASDVEFRSRFRREVRAATAVAGTATARLLAADPDSNPPWLATEYIAGPSLAEVVAAEGPLTRHLLRALAYGLAQALVAIHSAGVVHRDLKPGNVLITDAGPKVIDFGIAAATDSTVITRTGVGLGSPGYMAPEQITGAGQVGPATDLFAWALTVLYAATGRPPSVLAGRTRCSTGPSMARQTFRRPSGTAARSHGRAGAGSDATSERGGVTRAPAAAQP